MLAFLQSAGTQPVSRDVWNIFVKTGEISSAATFYMYVGMLSGPEALCGFKSRRSFATPFGLTMIFHMAENGLGPLLGSLSVSSLV